MSKCLVLIKYFSFSHKTEFTLLPLSSLGIEVSKLTIGFSRLHYAVFLLKDVSRLPILLIGEFTRVPASGYTRINKRSRTYTL